jgi:hypothetical protein
MDTRKDGRGIYVHIILFLYLFIRHQIKDMDDGMDDKGESCIEKARVFGCTLRLF